MNKNNVIAQSPGRINIIGEHTDYNEGLVLPAAIDKNCTFKLSRNGSEKTVNIISHNLKEQFSFELDHFSPVSGGWQNYVMGVVCELQKLGANLSGFNGEFEGDIPIGSGMSSSAALECSLALGLNDLFGLEFDKWQLIKAGQMAEHNFVGIKCGIMDQFASVMGKKNQVVLLDTRSLEFKYFPFDLGKYQLLLLNSNVSHSLATSAYNTRREECEESVRIIQDKFPIVKSLRDVSIQMLDQCAPYMPKNNFSRSRHVITENNRVMMSTDALLNKDFKALGRHIYQSHFSLQKDYEVSCVELDFLVELSLDKAYILGSRMMGGGFGGCTINVIEKEWVTTFIDEASLQFYNRFNIELTPNEVSIEDGASVRNFSAQS